MNRCLVRFGTIFGVCFALAASTLLGVTPNESPSPSVSASATGRPSPSPSEPPARLLRLKLEVPNGSIEVPGSVLIVGILILVLLGSLGSWLVFRRRSSIAQRESNDTFFRNDIARLVLTGGIGGLVFLSAVILLFAAVNRQYPNQVKDIFNALLPVFGTWVGTLLAFYFSRENFQAAANVSKAALGIADARLGSILAKDKMKQIDTPEEYSRKDLQEIKLYDLLKYARDNNKDRIALYKKNTKCIKCVVHVSLIDRFLAQHFVHPPSPPVRPEDLTVQDMWANPNFSSVVQHGFALVKATATLADAKAAMDSASGKLGSDNCYDAFVTENADQEDAVLGWITNDIIHENSDISTPR